MKKVTFLFIAFFAVAASAFANPVKPAAQTVAVDNQKSTFNG